MISAIAGLMLPNLRFPALSERKNGIRYFPADGKSLMYRYSVSTSIVNVQTSSILSYDQFKSFQPRTALLRPHFKSSSFLLHTNGRNDVPEKDIFLRTATLRKRFLRGCFLEYYNFNLFNGFISSISPETRLPMSPLLRL